ncbi:MAG: PDZ domain-containing protein, partial [Chloroflexota bacterium]
MRKASTIILSVVLLFFLLAGSFSAGAFTGYAISRNIKSANLETITNVVTETVPSITPDSITPELPDNHPPITTDEPLSLDNGSLGQLFAPFWEAWDIIHEQYVDQPLDDEALIVGATHGMISAMGNNHATNFETLPAPGIQETNTPEELEETFAPFWNVWATIHAPDDQVLMQGAISGMMDALGDQHSSYMSPDQFKQANIPMEGDYEGIGAWVDPTQEYLTVVSPMPGSPAEEAGLLPGDEVIAVDGDDMTGIDGNLVIRRVLGPADSKVVLT